MFFGEMSECSAHFFFFLRKKLSYLFILLLSLQSSLYILGINSVSHIWLASISFPFHRLPFHSVDCFSYCIEVCKSEVVLFIYFCFCCLCYRCHMRQILRCLSEVSPHIKQCWGSGFCAPNLGWQFYSFLTITCFSSILTFRACQQILFETFMALGSIRLGLEYKIQFRDKLRNLPEP